MFDKYEILIDDILVATAENVNAATIFVRALLLDNKGKEALRVTVRRRDSYASEDVNER